MIGDANATMVSLASFWTPVSRGNSRRSETVTAVADSASGESVWDELVRWFEQQHEWAELVAMFESPVD